ncbi:MAG: HAD family hydrolase [Gammaproteobacteria bacterium]|nr:HAD family hydrolase [Gammaproteobacteria bacterium]MBI5618248.1 HAD family hydrolase [Gammaproteobacteria bacterium]
MKRLPHARDPEVVESLARPAVILFDWHATLVDTHDAMYAAMDDMLPQLDALGLVARLLAPEASKTPEDARLLEYVREHRQLHPKIRAERRVSRSDLFEILFGHDDRAKHAAHLVFNVCYRNHFGEVHPLGGEERGTLRALRSAGITLGLLSNREREFLDHELAVVEGGSWRELFDVVVGGGDVTRRKPAPDSLLLALGRLGIPSPPGPENWYVGDSTTDVATAKRAGVTSVFFNGAGWEDAWLDRYFPGNAAYPHVPDVVVRDFREFAELCARCLGR